MADIFEIRAIAEMIARAYIIVRQLKRNLMINLHRFRFINQILLFYFQDQLNNEELHVMSIFTIHHNLFSAIYLPYNLSFFLECCTFLF